MVDLHWTCNFATTTGEQHWYARHSKDCSQILSATPTTIGVGEQEQSTKGQVSLPVASNGVEERNAGWRKKLGQKCGIQNEREPEDTDDDERDAPAEKLLRCYERPPR